jgi:hypothetical protein
MLRRITVLLVFALSACGGGGGNGNGSGNGSGAVVTSVVGVLVGSVVMLAKKKPHPDASPQPPAQDLATLPRYGRYTYVLVSNIDDRAEALIKQIIDSYSGFESNRIKPMQSNLYELAVVPAGPFSSYAPAQGSYLIDISVAKKFGSDKAARVVVDNYNLGQVDLWRQMMCSPANSQQMQSAVTSYCSRPRTDGGPELLIVPKPIENGPMTTALFVDLTHLNSQAFQYVLGRVQMQMATDAMGEEDRIGAVKESLLSVTLDASDFVNNIISKPEAWIAVFAK